MSDNTKTGILAIEDSYYIERNIVPMSDRGIFLSSILADDDAPFLKPLVKRLRFDQYISFNFNYQKISGCIVYEKKDYSHLVSAFSVKFSPKEGELDETELREACRLLSLKLQAHIQVKVSNKTLFSFVKGVELKSKTPKKQDFTFHKLFEHVAQIAEVPLQKYMDERFDFWLACGENETAECNAVYGGSESKF